MWFAYCILKDFFFFFNEFWMLKKSILCVHWNTLSMTDTLNVVQTHSPVVAPSYPTCDIDTHNTMTPPLPFSCFSEADPVRGGQPLPTAHLFHGLKGNRNQTQKWLVLFTVQEKDLLEVERLFSTSVLSPCMLLSTDTFFLPHICCSPVHKHKQMKKHTSGCTKSHTATS